MLKNLKLQRVVRNFGDVITHANVPQTNPGREKALRENVN